MRKNKTLVFFGAHPDDETFGMGSTLAQYASFGIKVYYVCSTRGEMGTVDPEYMKGYATIAELRTAEMKCASQVLGLADVFYLGYRDSGMSDSPDNKHPQALAMASLEEVAGRMVKIIRKIKPDVAITHDAGGSYGHPDHIATHKAAVMAFKAAGDITLYPEAGPVFQPSKLYFGIRPRGSMKWMIKLMPLFGQDPHHLGRNKDIDATKMMDVEYPVHAAINLSKQAIETRNKAAACHASQGGGQPPRLFQGPFWIFRIMEKFSPKRDYFMRAYPSPNHHRETDLFEGLKIE
jgi:N-acetyl-1-D-myo-inositol-2-amino-2-deoxy-alpha-D-glucopyranoside deacetylase